jgi:hypothetical protein
VLIHPKGSRCLAVGLAASLLLGCAILAADRNPDAKWPGERVSRLGLELVPE